jgi:hypothetical protein
MGGKALTDQLAAEIWRIISSPYPVSLKVSSSKTFAQPTNNRPRPFMIFFRLMEMDKLLFGIQQEVLAS